MFTIPPNMNFEVELLDSVYNDTLLSLSPAMSPVIGKETNSTQSKGITPYQGFFHKKHCYLTTYSTMMVIIC